MTTQDFRRATIEACRILVEAGIATCEQLENVSFETSEAPHAFVDVRNTQSIEVPHSWALLPTKEYAAFLYLLVCRHALYRSRKTTYPDMDVEAEAAESMIIALSKLDMPREVVDRACARSTEFVVPIGNEFWRDLQLAKERKAIQKINRLGCVWLARILRTREEKAYGISVVGSRRFISATKNSLDLLYTTQYKEAIFNKTKGVVQSHDYPHIEASKESRKVVVYVYWRSMRPSGSKSYAASLAASVLTELSERKSEKATEYYRYKYKILKELAGSDTDIRVAKHFLRMSYHQEW